MCISWVYKCIITYNIMLPRFMLTHGDSLPLLHRHYHAHWWPGDQRSSALFCGWGRNVLRLLGQHNTCRWTSYHIHKIPHCACGRNARNVFPATDLKGNRYLAIQACITACASRTSRNACRDRFTAVAGKTFPAFPAHAQPTILRIWQEAHGLATQGGSSLKAMVLAICN